MFVRGVHVHSGMLQRVAVFGVYVGGSLMRLHVFCVFCPFVPIGSSFLPLLLQLFLGFSQFFFLFFSPPLSLSLSLPLASASGNTNEK